MRVITVSSPSPRFRCSLDRVNLLKTDRLKTPQVALGGHGKRSIAGRAGRDSVTVFHTPSTELTTQTECKNISNLCAIPENSPN